MGVEGGFAVRARGSRRSTAAAFLIVMMTAAGARAASGDVEESASTRADPAAPQALGRVFAAGPTPPALFLMSSGGYGYTEGVLNVGDTHHRAAGTLAVDGRPLPWLGLGLRLDGRYDKHQSNMLGSDDGWIGDPRVFVRADSAIGSTVRIGGRVGIWVPGRAAPSVELAAITPEASGALTWAPGGVPLWLTANAGYRLNRSTRTATDAAMLSPNDRLGLEMSAFDQALVGLAAAYGAGRAQGFAELTGELMVGAGSPRLTESPMRAGAGVRFAITREVRLEAEAEAAVSARPTLSQSGPLVPIPPRAAVWLGLAYRFGGSAPAARPAPPPVVAKPAPAIARREGRIVGADGSGLFAAVLNIQADDGAHSVSVDGEGRFTLTGKPGQTLTVDAEAEGYELETATVTLAAEPEEPLVITLKRKLPGGQIRGLVRSFKGANLSAEIKIDPLGLTLRTQDGRFEADVAPGSYEVTITAPGYETQHRRVEVEKNGVTLLNADLRGER